MLSFSHFASILLIIIFLCSQAKVIATLLCVCNDNTHCFQNRTLNSIYKLPKGIRFCTTSSRGYCYKSYNTLVMSEYLFAKRSLIASKLNVFRRTSDWFPPDRFHKYGCLHFSSLVLLMCNRHASSSFENSSFLCCRNKNTCNYDLKPLKSEFINNTSKIKVSPTTKYHITLDHTPSSTEKESRIISPVTNVFVGPQILMKSQSKSKSSQFIEEPFSKTPIPLSSYSANSSSFRTAMVLLAGIFILLITMRLICYFTCPLYLSHKYCNRVSFSWLFDAPLPRPTTIMKSSSAASTNSTNLQESQSCCSSQLVPDKSFCGQQLIHKLEILTVQSLNRHYEQLSAKYEGEHVGVRILCPHCPSRSIILWKRFVLMNEKYVLRHVTLSGIKAADICLASDLRQCMGKSFAEFNFAASLGFTLSELYPWGSFFDMMQSSPARFWKTSSAAASFLRVISDIVNGLTFLHTDMEGTRGRPALAHRNLCLENAFLKPDGSSCLGGLEYAVCPPPTPLPVPIPQLLQMFAAHVQEWSFDASPPTQTAGDFSSDRCPSDKADCHPTEGTPTPVLVTKPPFPDWWPVCGLKVGDPICTAPELLEEKIFPFCFESHKRADIYALGVVMWEILAWAMGSAIGRPKSNEAQPPGGWVPHQSGLAAMRQMACLRQPNLLVLDAPKLDPITGSVSAGVVNREAPARGPHPGLLFPYCLHVCCKRATANTISAFHSTGRTTSTR
uniref:receptor protein serine/threonine kinase n=1 Tax=Mesocestoides corti TaxID=53468 RepID=A0A5K3EQ09_MESCO